ncbi:MAG: sensor histidine kinase [Nocardioidaceae bacterium]|nr:sensor histidine kinase [Nocardioidaceae bacterium]
MADRAGQVAGPSAVALFALVGLLQTRQPVVVAAGAAVLAVVVSAVLAWRSVGGWTLVAGLAVVAGGIAVVAGGASSNLGWFALCVVTGWCALGTRTVQAAAFTALLVTILGAQWIALDDDAGGGAWIAGTLFTTVVCVLARRQRILVDQLREAQSGLADRARAEERNRIAGEMHDVIGHALTVSTLHITSARLALDDDLDEARASLAEAERLGRQSLAEVRQAVGMLREHATRSVPLPDASRLPELVETFRRAGRSVQLEVVGDLDALTATSGLTVFRVVQESLTNVVRHAPAAGARVCLVVNDGHVRLTVDDDGGPGATGAGRGGFGIVSMRERAEAAGGRLTAGPTATGWRVEADLPGPSRGSA